jgi:hypothetical protein
MFRPSPKRRSLRSAPSRIGAPALPSALMAIPDGARRALSRQLEDRRQQRWSDLRDFQIRYRGTFAYITGVISDHHSAMPLFRLRYLGSPHQ